MMEENNFIVHRLSKVVVDIAIKMEHDFKNATRNGKYLEAGKIAKEISDLCFTAEELQKEAIKTLRYEDI